MLGDPNINLTVFVQNSNMAGILDAYEVCDACEDDSLCYQIDNILLSDFVYPSGFESFRRCRCSLPLTTAAGPESCSCDRTEWNPPPENFQTRRVNEIR